MADAVNPVVKALADSYDKTAPVNWDVPSSPVSKALKDAYRKYKVVKKAVEYGVLIREAFDEDERSAALFQLSVKAAIDVASAVLNTTLTSHPYFKYHKMHIEALSSALSIDAAGSMARTSFANAIVAADSTEKLVNGAKECVARRDKLLFGWGFGLRATMMLLSDWRKGLPGSAESIKSLTGRTPAELQLWARDALYDWRTNMAVLTEDVQQIEVMARGGVRATEHSMKVFDEKMKKLSSSDYGIMRNLAKIFTARIEEERDMAMYERMATPRSGSVDAVKDPAAFARRQAASGYSMAASIAACCDVAMSDDPIERPEIVADKLTVCARMA